MAELENAGGRRLCGAVRFVAAKVRTEVHVRHCGMRRRWSGGPEFAADCGANVAFEGAEKISTHRSSDWAEGAFRKICGTHLYYRIIDSAAEVVETLTEAEAFAKYAPSTEGGAP
ncbi:MAG: GFA family protein [Pseudomonadota bacterium]